MPSLSVISLVNYYWGKLRVGYVGQDHSESRGRKESGEGEKGKAEWKGSGGSSIQAIQTRARDDSARMCLGGH